MTRTSRQGPPNTNKSSASKGNADKRQSDLSRTITKLLRHQAENEKVKIDSQGWVNLDDLLAWRQLKDKQRFNPLVTLEDIFDVVEHDGKHGKGRFGLKSIDECEEVDGTRSNEGVENDGAVTGDMVDATADLKVTDDNKTSPAMIKPTEESKNNPLTIQTISSFRTNPQPASSYAIRATQGHSIKIVESEGLLTPITLDDPSSIPETVVHGTFHGAWNLIVNSGGLKPMGRNLVHFATGPASAQLPQQLNTPKGVKKPLTNKNEVDALLGQSKVVSGMRWDAQILIYIDIRRCLEDVKRKGLDMKWFRSENGVILTEGVILPEKTPEDVGDDTQSKTDTVLDEPDNSGQRSRPPGKKPAIESPQQKLVPMEYWSEAIEIKEGLGVLWRYGDGFVQDLPKSLASKSLPRGKQGHGQRGREGHSRGGKPRLRVERDVVGASKENDDDAGETNS